VDSTHRSVGLRLLRWAIILALAATTTALTAAGTTAARPAPAAALTALATTLSAALAAGTALAALARTRRAGFRHDLDLLRSQDLLQLGLDLFFEIGNLLLLVLGQVQLILREARNEMEPAAGAATTTRTAALTTTGSAARSTLAATAARRAVLCQQLHGNQGNRDHAQP
jgi:hypothetical protein